MKGFFSFWAISAFTGLLLNGCGSNNNKTTQQEETNGQTGLLILSPAQVEANNLTLGYPSEYEFLKTVTATGYLEALPKNQQTVSVWMGGVVRDLDLLPGQPVKQGQILFRIENPAFFELQESFLSESGNLGYLKDEFERQKALSDENIAAKKTFLKVQSDYAATKAKVESLTARLLQLHLDPDKIKQGHLYRQLAVPSPITGYVARVEGTNGKYASEASAIVEIVNPSPILIRLQVFEKDIVDIREGQMVRFTIPEVSSDTLIAQIIKTGKTLEENRTVNVHALFSTTGSLTVLPGMFVKAGIITGTFKAMALPVGALSGSEEKPFVLVKQNAGNDSWELVKKEVLPGFRDNKMVEILSGSSLSVSDQVVVSGAFAVAGH